SCGAATGRVRPFRRVHRGATDRSPQSPLTAVFAAGAAMTQPFVDAIALPDGTLIRGRGSRGPVPAGPSPDFGLYLGRPPDARRRRLRRRAGRPPEWPVNWIDWPDFRTPRDDHSAAAAICQAYLVARSGYRVEIACRGGTGRTGTVIACMAVLAGCPAV